MNKFRLPEIEQSSVVNEPTMISAGSSHDMPNQRLEEYDIARSLAF